MAARLLHAGFDIEALDVDIEAALFWATRAGDREAVELLLRKRGDVTAKDENQ
jgi:ankyrin repeat protein